MLNGSSSSVVGGLVVGVLGGFLRGFLISRKGDLSMLNFSRGFINEGF